MKIISFKNILLFIGLFLLTLVNHKIYSWALGLAMLVAYMLIYKVPVSKKAAFEGGVIVFLIIISALRFQFFMVGEVLPVFVDAFWGKFAGLMLCAMLWVVLRSLLLGKEVGRVLNLLKPLLIIHLSAFYLQFIVYLLTGYYIDLLEPFTGETSRYMSFDSSLAGIGSFRPTGFLVEPSTYFMIIFALLSLLLIHEGFTKNTKLFYITLISMYLSFSTAAVIIATLSFGYYLYVKKMDLKIYFGIFIVVLVSLAFSLSTLERLYDSQLNKADKSSGIRFELINLTLKRDTNDAIFAFGPFALDADIYIASAVVSKYNGRQAASLNDSGLLVYFWIYFGIAGFLLFVYLCIKMKFAGKHRLPLFLLLSLTKISFLHPVFIIYIAASLTKKVKSYND